MLLVLIALGAWFSFGTGDAAEQKKDAANKARREVFEPGLILETGARMAPCDVLLFTPDGSRLLAVGDDKVVRNWACTPNGLDPNSVRALRWAIYRDRRGCMYAMDVSPDGRSVVVGGFGLRRGNLAVFDLQKGIIQYAVKSESNGYIWSVAFSPRGNQVAFGADDGTVWLWNLRGKSARRLGRHPGKGTVYVRLVRFLGNDQVLSVASTGQVARWRTSRTGAPVAEVFRFQKTGNLYRAAIDPKHRWIAAAGQTTGEKGKDATVVEVRSLDGRRMKLLPLPQTQTFRRFPKCLAFDARGQRLAVGTYNVLKEAKFYNISQGNVLLYNLDSSKPRPRAGPNKLSWYPDAVAFHPDGRRLAVAGGDDHEVTLWDLERPDREISKISSPGSGIWNVAFSQDGHSLGYRAERQPDPATPNDRGKGPWRVFDLSRRQWARADQFQPIQPRESLGGWKVEPDRHSAFVWRVVDRNGRSYKLPLEADRDGRPYCFTFFPSPAGKVRLAVGHYWGVSIYEMTRGKPKLVQLFSGHQGPVMTVGVSADNKVLLSGSWDQTIAAWNLTGWRYQPVLGARFAPRVGRVMVEEVDPGSPAWEVGLTPGDEIVQFAFDRNQLLYDPGRRFSKDLRDEGRLGSADDCLKRLTKPESGKEFFFGWKHPGDKNIHYGLTSLRQRPVWVFYPTRGNDWVLWRWRDYFYDTSTNGDSLIGWQVSGDYYETPAFYPARNFQQFYHKPDKVAETIRNLRVAPQQVKMPEMQPPRLEFEVEDRGATVAVTMRATPLGEREYFRPERCILWIDDYLYRKWPDLDRWQRVKRPAQREETYERKENIPKTELRTGLNRLTFQCYNRAGGYGKEQRTVTVTRTGKSVKPNLHVLLVGVEDYSRVKLPRSAGRLPNLDGINVDIERLKDALLEEKNKLFNQLPSKPLLNKDVTHDAVLGRLRDIARRARPDDLLIFFLDGHGLSHDYKDPSRGKQFVVRPKQFVFVCSNFDFRNRAETGISGDELYEALVNIRCRKLVLISACHSGDATVHAVRDLTQDGVGPMVWSACSPQESAWITQENGSLFTQAILEALDDRFTEADTLKDGKLDTRELADFLYRRVPQLLKKLKKKAADRNVTQVPDFFPRRDNIEHFPIYQK
jgi:WD40 repeat protein